MSDINLDFTVSNNSIDFTVQPNEITITPTDVQLSVFASGAPLARGSNTEVQYNNEGLLEGSPNFTFDETTNQLSVGQVLTGNLIATGNVSIGGYVTSDVVNITASNLASEYSNLGNVANVKIGGGTNGYVLQTDGAGNLDWTAMSGGGGGNGTPGGSNTQIQYNDAGTFGGNAGFTFNEISGNVNVPSNLIAVGNIVANNFIGNFSGNVGNANYAAYAGNVTIASQPNITSLGTLTSLTVTGNSNTGNIYTSGVSGNISGANVISANTFTATGNITANYFLGNGSQLTGISVSTANISNGNSNVNIATANGNVTVTAGGTTSLTVSNANVTGRQFISNVATGTAPFVVTSTTLVANLRVANATFANSATNATTATTVTSTTTDSTVGSLTANSYVVPLSNASASLGFTGQRFSNLFVGNIYFSGNLTGGTSAPVAAVTTTPTNKLPIVIGGVTYYICLTSAV